jgi:hypothetical protein
VLRRGISFDGLDNGKLINPPQAKKAREDPFEIYTLRLRIDVF